MLIIINTNAYSGTAEMEYACSSIPGMDECKRMNSSSFWVIMSNASIRHDYRNYGSMLCNGGQRNFGVSKGYSITFWSRDQRELYKYRCY